MTKFNDTEKAAISSNGVLADVNLPMTKQEAIFAMIRGKKVTHRYFTIDEYIYMKGQQIFSEDGVNHGVTFWHYRQGEEWNTDWQIYIG